MGFDPRRLAEIIVTDGAGPGRRGTGYRITTTSVLTAAHVVAGATAVTVRFDAERPTEWTSAAQADWCDSATDLAVLTISPPDAVHVPPAGYGRLDDVGAFVSAHTAGFPRWKLRAAGRGGVFALRDLHHATARVAAVSNRRTGRLEVEVSPPRDTADADGSPWEGMSGAPLWAGDRIIGVIAEHHRNEGPNWLTAIRVDRCLDAAGPQQARLAGLLGLAGGPAALTSVTGAAPSPVTVHTVLPPIPEFIGRAKEIHAVTARVAAAAQAGQVVAIHAIDGMPGIGKTALATQLWHLLGDRFPERLFVDLHAHTPGLAPADPADALASLLRTIGVDPRNLPDGLDERTAMWRERMAGQRALLVLDNVASSAQVNPLLPASPNCLVLITSRRHLGDLATTAVDVSLDALTPDEAVQMFLRLAPRAVGDAGRVADVVALCGHLPLAIGLIARLYTKHPRWTIDDLIARTRAKLLTMRVEHQTIAAVFDLSYQYLTAEQQRVFRALSLHPGVEIDPYAAAALTGLSLDEAGERLEALFGDHLLDEVGYDRYRMHDLVADYARARALTMPTDQRDEAIARLLDYYQHTAAAASIHLPQRSSPADPAAPVPATPTPDLPGYASAVAWLRTERANLLACVQHAQQHDEHRTRLVDLTARVAALLRLDGPWAQAIELHTQALDVYREVGDRLGQAKALVDLGSARSRVGDYAGSEATLRQSLALYRELDDRLGQANALAELGTVRRLTDDYAAAIEFLQQAMGIYEEFGDRIGQAGTLSEMGIVRATTGDYPWAAQALQRALAIYQELGERQGQANVIRELGQVRYLTGDLLGAAQAMQEALSVFREFGIRGGQANALIGLGRTRYLTGDLPGSAAAFQEALDINLELGSLGGQGSALNDLGTVRRLMGNYPGATEALQRALATWQALGSKGGQANSLNELGKVRYTTGALAGAVEALQASMDLFQEIGDRAGYAHALNGLGITRRLLGDYSGAAEALQEALEIDRGLGHLGGEVEILNDIGVLHRARGDLDQARQLHRQALDLARRINSEWDEAHALAGLGRCALAAGQPTEALPDLRHALEIFRRIGTAEAAELSTEVADLEAAQDERPGSRGEQRVHQRDDPDQDHHTVH